MVPIQGVDLELFELGNGPPLLYLHEAEGVPSDAPFLASLAQRFRVLAPSHPGFGRSSLPEQYDSVSDLAFLYLDLLDELSLSDVCLLGTSFGGWVAAEIAVRSCQRLSHLVLVDPIGIKVGDREQRDIADFFALPAEELRRRTYFRPPPQPDTSAMSDDELAVIARNQAAFALYIWEPFAHNPKLRSLLHRVSVPTLLIWGEHDGIVSTQYGEQYRRAIRGAHLEVIANAGHLPHIEQPEAFVERVLTFVEPHS
jgi:pimeloyl-ACP methyl ester carboxylesterase